MPLPSTTTQSRIPSRPLTARKVVNQWSLVRLKRKQDLSTKRKLKFADESFRHNNSFSKIFDSENDW
ncbi:unnamed protein product [Blepharisma stoltei]|uniref:Uncharacterized protein n=1 Tax=Blepharisma stoltei TaxID=1481888 RepID=A0AAU9KLI6_9CILI|nr:unnamed protein product [Blepharisma stoltei]